MTKKKLNEKRPGSAGARAPASKPASNNLLAILRRNAARTTEPELLQRLHAAIREIEARNG
jgi:hypothetical protein